MLKHYVELFFITPVRTKDLEVEKRDENSFDLPKGVAKFSFFVRNEFLAEDGEILCGIKKNFSPWKYLVSPELIKDAYKNYLASLGKPGKPEGPSKEFGRRMRNILSN